MQFNSTTMNCHCAAHCSHIHRRYCDSPSGLNLSNKPTFKLSCQLNPNFHLTVGNEKVVLAPSDPSDQFQFWYKDDRYSLRVKDKELFNSFALVNKASGHSIKANGNTKPVKLIPYNPVDVDKSVLWSESHDLGDGYRSIWMIDNIHLNLDALLGDGTIENGTVIGLWKWKNGSNQKWKITPQSLNEGGSQDLKGNNLTVTDSNASGKWPCTCQCMNNSQCESLRWLDREMSDYLLKNVNEIRKELHDLKNATVEAREEQMETLRRRDQINESRNELNAEHAQVTEANARNAAMQDQIETLRAEIQSLTHENRLMKEDQFVLIRD